MDMTMSSAAPSRVEVVTSVQRRRRWTPEQKLEIVKQTNEPGSSVSMVARQFGISAAQLFQWRKAYLQGSLMAVGANEPWCQHLNCKRPCAASNNLKAHWAVRLWRSRFSRRLWTSPKQKNGLRARQYCPGASSESRLLCSERVAQPCVGHERSPLRMGRPEKVTPKP